MRIVDEIPKDSYDGFVMEDRSNNRLLSIFRRNVHVASQWLTPGIGVKRWMVLVLLGITMIAVGLAILILDVYRTAPETWWLPLISAASLRFLPRILRAVIFGGMGLALVVGGIWGLNRSILKPFVRPGRKVVDTLAEHRKRERGPRIVVIGGGHGLSILLRSLKSFTNNITAIVTVADDGGSSGRLRRTLGILPPGDIRNCLAALSNDEAMLSELFQYRFPSGSIGLDGHSFGNLFITALSDITGSFEGAIAESGRVLSVSGQVLPSTLHDVELVADVVLPYLVSEIRVQGESQIPESTGRVQRVWLEPNSPPAFPQAIQAILNADIILVGPGSLYTSILPNLLVPDIADAIRSSRGLRMYICNVATQRGETTGYTCGDHLHALEEHTGGRLFDMIICNNYYEGNLPDDIQFVRLDEVGIDYPVYCANLVDLDHPWRHDGEKLGHAVIDLYEERTGPLTE